MTVDIIQGDCTDILPRYEGRVDLIVTSPPYDDLRNYGGSSDFDFEDTAPLLVDALCEGGVLCWNVQDSQNESDYSLTSCRQALRFQALGMKCKEKLIYERSLPRVISPSCYLRAYELVYVFTKGMAKTFNPIEDRKNIGVGLRRGGDSTGRMSDNQPRPAIRTKYVAPTGRRSDVWRYPAGYHHTAPDMPSAHDVHPAIMPLALAKDLIRSYSNEGDLVLDPFVGSGTTAAAAKFLLRDCVGIDINEEYCEFARLRTAQELLV